MKLARTLRFLALDEGGESNIEAGFQAAAVKTAQHSTPVPRCWRGFVARRRLVEWHGRYGAPRDVL
jgi:hypothetical protein